jgi:GMC oxidoreductase
VDFWLSTEDLPNPDNRVSVDRQGNITLSYTPNNQAPKQKLYDKLKSMLQHLGMHPDYLIPRNAYLKTEIPIAGVAHQAGTCGFGRDPASSVLDVNCKAHELDNLYIVDTSFFVSIGAVNPSLTAMANAIRVGEHIAERLGKRDSCHGEPKSAWSTRQGWSRGWRWLHSRRPVPSLPVLTARFSTSRYGKTQVILAIAASSLGPGMARRWTLKRVLRAGMSADLLAMILLASGRLLQGVPSAAYGILLLATGCLGFGFGMVVMALNTYAEEFFPGRKDRAVLSLNALLGAGTALAPLLVAIFTGLGAWWLLPLTVAAALAGLLVVSACQPFVASAGAAGADRSAHFPLRFWLFAAAVLLYGIAETLNGNWSGPYLTEDRGVSAGGASFALTAFWAMVTIGRILFAVLSSKWTVRWIYASLPILLIVASQAILRVRSETGGIVTFGLAGLACGRLWSGALAGSDWRSAWNRLRVRLAGGRCHASGRARRGRARSESSREIFLKLRATPLHHPLRVRNQYEGGSTCIRL